MKGIPMATFGQVQIPSSSEEARPLSSEAYVPRAMPRILGTFDLIAVYVLALFAFSSAPTSVLGGASAFMYWLLSAAVFFVPCAIVTAQLGVMYPHTGSLYNWTQKALGPFWSFFIGLCSWLPGPLVMAGLGEEFVQFLQGLHPTWLATPWQQGFVILGIVLVAMALSLQRSGVIRNVINSIFILEIIATIILFLSGLFWMIEKKPVATNFLQSFDWHVITPDTYGLYGLIIFAFIGTNLPLNMGGEIKEKSAISRHLFWGSLLVVTCYLCSTFAILAVQGVKAGGVTFAVVSTIDIVFGHVASALAAICFISATIGAAAEYNYVYARILLAAGIDRRLPVAITRLNKNRAPVSAVIFQAIVAAVFTILAFLIVPMLPFGSPTDLNVDFYYVTQAVATIIWVFSTLFLFVDVYFLYRQNKAAFYEKRIFPMPVLWVSCVVGVLAIISAIVNTLFYAWIPQISNGQWALIVGCLTFIVLLGAAMGSMFASSQATYENFEV